MAEGGPACRELLRLPEGSSESHDAYLGRVHAADRSAVACQGCHAYQGYLFTRPLPLQEFEQFMQ